MQAACINILVKSETMLHTVLAGMRGLPNCMHMYGRSGAFFSSYF